MDRSDGRDSGRSRPGPVQPAERIPLLRECLIMETNSPPGRFFAVTNPGLSATRWLAFVLASNKDVFVAHGKHQLDSVIGGDFQREKAMATVDSLARGNDLRDFYESRSLEDILAHYKQVMPGAS